MAVTPKQLDIKGAYIQDAYIALEDEIVKVLIKRLNTKTKTELTKDNVFKWQLEKMNELGITDLETISKITGQTAATTKEQLQDMILKEGYKIADESNKEFANLMNVDRKAWTEIDQILNGYFNSSWLDLDNHINQTLITTNYSNNPATKMYQQTLNNVVSKVLTGFQTPEKALRSAIYEMVDKGISTTFIDKGGHEWGIERYVRTVIKSTTHRVYNDLRLERSKEYGIVTALMSSHIAARPACSQIQGGWVLTVRKEEAPEEYQYMKSIYDFGYGKPEGTQGINCSHRLYIAIPGIQTNNIPEPPTPAEAQKNAEIVASQRRMETAIRKAKRALKAAEQMEVPEDVDRFKNLVRKRQMAMRQLINDNPRVLNRDYSREQVTGQ